jgi:hypothetical protein
MLNAIEHLIGKHTAIRVDLLQAEDDIFLRGISP